MTISRLFFAVAAAAGIAAAQPQIIAVAVDGISGPSQQVGLSGQCEVLSWAFGATDPASSTTPGTTTGKTQVSALVLTRQLDTCSPNLFRYATIGQHINTVKLSEYKGGGNRPLVMVVTLSEAMVSSYQIGGSEAGQAPAESVSIVFSKITFEYYPTKADGETGAPIIVSYDVTKGY